MGESYEWFDQRRTLEILDESLVVPDARPKKSSLDNGGQPLPAIGPYAQQWFNDLPEKVRPNVLRCKFPHILERIQQEWESPRGLDRLFTNLMVDDRGGRRGFPFNAVREIYAIRDYYFDVLMPETKDLLKPRAGLKGNL